MKTLSLFIILNILIVLCLLTITPSYSAIITLDAGHGGVFSGAVYEGVAEKDLNLAITHKLRLVLETMGHTVIMTRVTDTELSVNHGEDLLLRQRLGNGSDAFISIHCNAATNPNAFGFEVWTSKGYDHSDALADYMVHYFPKDTLRVDMSDGDVDKEADFLVLQGKVPSVLVELGFMSNHNQLVGLCSPEVQTMLAQILAMNINSYVRMVRSA